MYTTMRAVLADVSLGAATDPECFMASIGEFDRAPLCVARQASADLSKSLYVRGVL